MRVKFKVTTTLLSLYHYNFAVFDSTNTLNQIGPIAVRLMDQKAMRNVKSDILDLFVACLEICSEFREFGANGKDNKHNCSYYQY